MWARIFGIAAPILNSHLFLDLFFYLFEHVPKVSILKLNRISVNYLNVRAGKMLQKAILCYKIKA
jgi:hypothetical protein